MKTKRNRIAALAASVILAGCAASARAAALPVPPQAAKAKPTQEEYKAFQTADAEKNPQQKVKLLDDFMAKYPTSEYLPYVYNEYWQTYATLKQWSKVIEYLDKILALPEIQAAGKLEAYYRRAATFEYAYNAKSPDLVDGSTKGRDAALAGLKVLSTFEKPAQATDEQWAAAKKTYSLQFYNTAAIASFYLKDFKAAAENFHAALGLEPKQPVDDYRMGLAQLQENPPEAVPGFWAIARAIDLQVPDAEKVTKFLHDKISDYQSPGCDASVDAEVKELLALAQNSPDPPAGYTIASVADLNKVREQANIQTVLADLKAGGDKAKLTWLAVCGGEFPEAIAKPFEINAATPDAIVITAALGTSDDEVNAITAPFATLKIAGQPNAARLDKDTNFRFGGKLTGYTSDPYNLTWENVKVNTEDIPEEKGKKPAKKPGKKP